MTDKHYIGKIAVVGGPDVARQTLRELFVKNDRKVEIVEVSSNMSKFALPHFTIPDFVESEPPKKNKRGGHYYGS